MSLNNRGTIIHHAGAVEAPQMVQDEEDCLHLLLADLRSAESNSELILHNTRDLQTVCVFKLSFCLEELMYNMQDEAV